MSFPQCLLSLYLKALGTRSTRAIYICRLSSGRCRCEALFVTAQPSGFIFKFLSSFFLVVITSTCLFWKREFRAVGKVAYIIANVIKELFTALRDSAKFVSFEAFLETGDFLYGPSLLVYESFCYGEGPWNRLLERPLAIVSKNSKQSSHEEEKLLFFSRSLVLFIAPNR